MTIKIHAHHRKPIDTSFHKGCRNVVKNEFYHYMPKADAKGYVNNAHTISVRVSTDVNNGLRGIFCNFLKSIGETITDKALYLLSLLQKVGEDKIRESVGYNNSLCSQLQTMTLEDLSKSGANSTYLNNITDTMFKDCLGLSIFVTQAIIFAFNAFRTIWGQVKPASN